MASYVAIGMIVALWLGAAAFARSRATRDRRRLKDAGARQGTGVAALTGSDEIPEELPASR
ncbi:hypothetical protein [Phytoactinopolyspora limicola]|uniref:hypothetical protein n=1 Tax=Phytoactinopolyspora limicola TaxID=2715536 RepID=UPI00140BCB02|nr:hypothetical protein [Phytoactinopolyspora limicola]